jgi:ABC-2 type transport system ATP-binding protein
MLLGLAARQRHVSVFGRSPREAVDAGLVGAMLQTGALIRDLSVRELVTMMASLYPDPMDVDEALELTGLKAIAGQRTQKLSGGRPSASASRSRSSATPTCSCSTSRRSRWTSRAPRVLEHHARVRGARQDGVFATHYLEEADANADRAILMAHGRIVADGPTTEIKARVGRRTIRATLPDVDPASARRAAGRRERRAPRRRGDPQLHRTPTRRSGRCSSASRRRATSRSPAPGSRRRSSS